MQPRPPFDRALLIPIAIGVVSILGIGWILLTSDLGQSVIPPTVTSSSSSSFEDVMPTATQSPLAPSTEDETPEAQTPSTATGTLPAAYPGPPTETLPSSLAPSIEDETPEAQVLSTTTETAPPAETLPSTSILVTESLPTPSVTYTPDQIKPLRAGKYDDTDPNIAYDRYWTGLKNLSTASSYGGTIHASTGIGNEASFRFTGDRFRLGYKRGKNFGIVTVLIDDQPYSFHEEAFDLVWSSPQLSPGDHFVRIIHESGESINLDYIEILD